MNLFFDKTYLDHVGSSNSTISLNLNIAVYESSDINLYHFCKAFDYLPEKVINEKSDDGKEDLVYRAGIHRSNNITNFVCIDTVVENKHFIQKL